MVAGGGARHPADQLRRARPVVQFLHRAVPADGRRRWRSISLPLDRPGGYIQRTGLAIFAFMLFGAGLAHLGYMAQRPELPAVRAAAADRGGAQRRVRLHLRQADRRAEAAAGDQPEQDASPARSARWSAPSVLVALIAWPIFRGTPLDHWYLLLGLGAIVSLARPGGRPDAVLDQARPGDQGHGRRHSRPWRRCWTASTRCCWWRRRRSTTSTTTSASGWTSRPGCTRAECRIGSSGPRATMGLTPAERLRSLGRERGLGGWLIADGLARPGARPICALSHRLQVTGREHLPHDPPFVMVAQPCEPSGRAGARRPRCRARLARRAYALAAGRYVLHQHRQAPPSPPTRSTRCRSGASKTSARDLDRAAAAPGTRTGAVLILFPEGTRTPDRRDGPVPARDRRAGGGDGGAGGALLPRGRVRRLAAGPAAPAPGRLRLAIGPPLTFEQAGHNREALHAVSARCEEAVRALATWEIRPARFCLIRSSTGPGAG